MSDLSASVEVCGAKHPTSWWITCQLDTDHFGEHVRDCPPVEVGERLKFSQLTVHWQDPCECDSHTGVGEDLWKCDECGEVIRYVDDPQGRIVVTTLHPYNDRRVRVEMVTPGDRPGNLWETDDVGIPSVDVCSFCADPECDGIGCIGSLDSNETADHDTIEQLHDLIRAGAAWKIMQTHGYVVAERALAHAEHRVAHEFGVEGAEPVTWREWQVISDDGGGVSFSVNVLDFDSERVAARWVRPGTHLAMAEYRRWTSTAVLVARKRHETRCPRDVGKRPRWMSPDQYDPCQCTLTAGHQPPCRCLHGADEPSTSEEADRG